MRHCALEGVPMIDPIGKRQMSAYDDAIAWHRSRDRERHREAMLAELRAIARRSNPETHLLNYSPAEAEDVRLWEIELQAEASIRYWEGE